MSTEDSDIASHKRWGVPVPAMSTTTSVSAFDFHAAIQLSHCLHAWHIRVNEIPEFILNHRDS